MLWAYRCHGLCKKWRITILDPRRQSMRVLSSMAQYYMREGKVEKKAQQACHKAFLHPARPWREPISPPAVAKANTLA